MRDWLVDTLTCVGLEVHPEFQMHDLYGNKARADLAIFAEFEGRPFYFTVELKVEASLSRNAANGFAQAFHYREFCTAADDRCPDALSGTSPALSFAGIFDMSREKMHTDRRLGMEILTTKVGVGALRYYSWRNTLEFWLGEYKVLCLSTGGRVDPWPTGLEKYIFGKQKRNGSRRGKQSVAESISHLHRQMELFI